MLRKLIFNYGVKKRNPSLLAYLAFLNKSDKWSANELQTYQVNKCKEFLEFAYDHSPFYKEVFDTNHFDPSKFKDLVQLKQLPTFSKSDLIVNNNEIQSNFPFKKLVTSRSSGTTGKSLEFLKNEEWDSHTRAAIFRGYGWYNVEPWDKNGYLWGYNIDPKEAKKIKLLDWLQNRFRLFTYTQTEIEKFTKKLKTATYLHGYSSMIYEVAKKTNAIGNGKDYNLKMVKGTAEKIYESYQEEVKKAFGLKMISEYGSAESGTIAFECPKGNMHIAMENVIVEEENGEVVVTNLLSKSFPIIRYKLGDGIQLAPTDFKCKCGRAHPVILNVLGRVGKKIIGKESEYPNSALNYVFKNLAKNHKIFLNFQARQDYKGFVELKIEQKELGHGPILEKELKNYFKDDIEFTIKYGQNFHKMDGKLIDFLTTLNN